MNTSSAASSKLRLVISAAALCAFGAFTPAPADGEEASYEISAEPPQVRAGGLEIRLAAPKAGMGLLGITHRTSGDAFLVHEGDPADAKLWEVLLTEDRTREDELFTIDNTVECERSVAVRDDGRQLICRWEHIDLPGQEDALDVIAMINVGGREAEPRWRIRVRNRSLRYGIWRVHFPILRVTALSQDGQEDYLVVPPAEGRSVRDPVGVGGIQPEVGEAMITTTNAPDEGEAALGTDFGFGACKPHGLPYPGGRAQMQWLAYYRKSGNYYYASPERGPGLYVATHDPAPAPKLFFVTPRPEEKVCEIVIGQFPEDVAQPGLDYFSAYPTVVAGFEGDWYDAARRYRRWALQQKWAARGPLHRREDIPEWLLNTTAVYRAGPRHRPNEIHVPPGEFYEENLPGPLMTVWYQWSVADKRGRARHGAGAKPTQVEAPEGFAEHVRRLQAGGGAVLPYINSRLWANYSAGFEDVLRYLILEPDGQPNVSNIKNYSAGHVCVQTDFWEAYLVRVAEQIARRYGVRGLYIDQAGGCRYTGRWDLSGCHDPDHGHPLGVTADLVRAEHDRMLAIKQAVEKIDPRFVLCGEGSAETFIDVLSNKVIHYQLWPGMVPLFNTVYHDYMTSYGRKAPLWMKDLEDPICRLSLAWELAFGNQMGRLSPGRIPKGLEEYPEMARNFEMLRRICEIRAAYPEFVNYGQMIRPPVLLGELPELTTKYFNKEVTANFPAVAASLWRSHDGRVAVVAANASKEPVTLHVDFDREDIGLGGKIAVRWMYPEPAAPQAVGEEGLEIPLDGRAAVLGLIEADETWDRD